jgi:hypothetical protein
MQANTLTDRATDVAYRSADAGQKRIAAFRADRRQLFFQTLRKINYFFSLVVAGVE